MKKETEIWLSIAEEDYKNMKVMNDTKSLRGAVLFAQQSVEKILKAYICEYTKISPKRTHFIETLIKDTKLDIGEIGSPKIEQLSVAYEWARYSDLSQVHFKTLSDIKPLLIMAETIYIWVKKKLKRQ